MEGKKSQKPWWALVANMQANLPVECGWHWHRDVSDWDKGILKFFSTVSNPLINGLDKSASFMTWTYLIPTQITNFVLCSCRVDK